MKKLFVKIAGSKKQLQNKFKKGGLIINSFIIGLTTKAGEILINNSVSTINSKIETAKATKNDKKTIQELEEIINELIDDRRKLDSIIKEYDEVLSTQKISEKDIDYMTTNIVPIITELFESDLVSSDESEDMSSYIELFKPLLSVETITILQLIGFNFKEALGIPLTKLTQSSITMNKDTEKLEYELNIAANKRQEEFFKLLQTNEGREYYQKFFLKDNQDVELKK